MCDAPKINQMLLRKIFAQFQLKYFCLKQVDRIATRGRRGGKEKNVLQKFFFGFFDESDSSRKTERNKECFFMKTPTNIAKHWTKIVMKPKKRSFIKELGKVPRK